MDKNRTYFRATTHEIDSIGKIAKLPIFRLSQPI
jgi:hypothetical protein